MQDPTDHPAKRPNLDEALSTARNVSSSLALLADLYGQLGITRQDADAANLSHMLEMILEKAERVGRLLENA